ncbi:MAG TPA: deoxyribodipyrimidine photo-lyase [Ignavibacteriaceae bacterium]|jgi:deoxyribodipyrimidine photo-lyase|nr:deoxyribodipyrimidine photo-lyase [Ignavibacteriaceae bacterium]
MNLKRGRKLNPVENGTGNVLYWMSREQRVNDNWALLFSQDIAVRNNKKLVVAFTLVPEFLNASFRQYDFMMKGLQEVEKNLKDYNIPFYLLSGQPEERIKQFVDEYNISAVVTDFDPLKIKRIWKQKLIDKIRIPVYEVDSHNIVPCFWASNKEEFGAYTLRPKIHRNLPGFLDEFPELKKMKDSNSSEQKDVNWDSVYDSIKIDHSIKPVTWIKPGEFQAQLVLEEFINSKIQEYNSNRNNPVIDGQSNLSPYLHFGQISAQRIALNVKKYAVHSESTEAFLEELIVRKELSDNFCYFNSNYDSFTGFRDWAKATLDAHRKDRKDYVYSLEDFEAGKTDDPLWNAAQKQLRIKGKMHGYMRMYWAKKILEWSETPEKALEFSIYLNDKYQLDGRDPNGYTGCAWSIGGIHDRAWGERSVFGKIRYMNYNGCKRKFDVDAYIGLCNELESD